MNRKKWKTKIVKACKDAGTYEEYFSGAIDALSEILEKRDSAAEQYEALGALPVIEHTNQGGATNYVKHPAVVLWNELNTSALAYWRELGLTPSSFKKATGEIPKKEKSGGLLDELAAIRNELKSG